MAFIPVIRRFMTPLACSQTSLQSFILQTLGNHHCHRFSNSPFSCSSSPPPIHHGSQENSCLISSLQSVCLPCGRLWQNRTPSNFRSPNAEYNSAWNELYHVPRRRWNSNHIHRRTKQTLLRVLRPRTSPTRLQHRILFIHSRVIPWKTHQHLSRRRLARYYSRIKRVRLLLIPNHLYGSPSPSLDDQFPPIEIYTRG